MKRIFKTIGIIGVIACAYLLGAMQAETITEVKTITAVKEIEKVVEVVPDGCINTLSEEFYNNYIDMRQVIDFNANEDGLPLYLEDGTGYYWER